MRTIYPDSLYHALAQLGMQAQISEIKDKINATLSEQAHGDFAAWQAALNDLPKLIATRIDLNTSAITVTGDKPLTQLQSEQLLSALQALHPWRKGPFNLFGHYIDTEWRSDWKWDRLCHEITPLHGRAVLDIGCGSGYHCWRMRGAGADLVVGIDPTLIFVMQYFALQHYIQDTAVNVLPLGMDDISQQALGFDTVFSMGLLYHRRDPIQHLNDLKQCLRAGGELVLETLVIEGKAGEVLIPQGRYAQMRNVWSIPSVVTLEDWLRQCGYKHVRCIDNSKTTVDEQRSTAWMRFQSLPDFLDQADKDKTIEGYPAPRRAILIAER